jgi:Spy/CpxP family protein refolding chaperone
MNSALKWKLVLGFILVFLAGAATGSFLAANRVRHLREDFERHPHSLAERMRSRMQARLNLTPEQIAKTAPIFEKAARELENIRADTNQHVRQILAEADRELAPVLTAEQQTQLETIEKQRHKLRAPRNSARRRNERPPP